MTPGRVDVGRMNRAGSVAGAAVAQSIFLCVQVDFGPAEEDAGWDEEDEEA